MSEQWFDAILDGILGGIMFWAGWWLRGVWEVLKTRARNNLQ